MSEKHHVVAYHDYETKSIGILINDTLHILFKKSETSIFSWIDEKEEFKYKIQFAIKGNNEKIIMEYEDVELWKNILVKIISKIF